MLRPKKGVNPLDHYKAMAQWWFFMYIITVPFLLILVLVFGTGAYGCEQAKRAESILLKR